MSLSEKVTDSELRDVVLNLLVAGRDTTAQLLTVLKKTFETKFEFDDDDDNNTFSNVVVLL